jgi:hypothetical protein
MSLNTGEPKLFDFDSSKRPEVEFPIKQWGGEASGVPGATNLPSIPVAPLSIKVHDPNNVTTLVPYSGEAALNQIEGQDLKPLAGMGSGGFAGVSNSTRGKTDPFDSKKFTDDNPFRA